VARSYSRKFSSHLLVNLRVAGESLILLLSTCLMSTSIVEFESEDEAKEAKRKLSDKSYMGRSVFIREVCGVSDART
jgi:hypothetical protein